MSSMNVIGQLVLSVSGASWARFEQEGREKILADIDIVEGLLKKVRKPIKKEALKLRLSNLKLGLKLMTPAFENIIREVDAFATEVQREVITDDEVIYGDNLTVEEVSEEDSEFTMVARHGHKAKLEVIFLSYESKKNRLSHGIRKIYMAKVVSPGNLNGKTIMVQGQKLWAKVENRKVSVWGLVQVREGQVWLEGSKVLKEKASYKSEMEMTDEEFLQAVESRYISMPDKQGMMEIVAPGWKAEWVDGPSTGSNRTAGDRKSQAQDRLATALAYFHKKYGPEFGVKVEKYVWSNTQAHFIDLRGQDGNDQKVELANGMAQVVLEWTKATEVIHEELKAMSKEELWGLVPEKYLAESKRQWQEKMLKRQSRWCLIEKAQALKIGWVNQAIDQAMKPVEWKSFGSNWIEAKDNILAKLLADFAPYKGRCQKEVYMGLAAAVEFGLTHRSSIKLELLRHLSYWHYDKEGSKQAWLACMAGSDLRFQQWLEESGGVDDNRLEESGETRDESRWAREYLDYLWAGQYRDRETWIPQAKSALETMKNLE